MRRVLMLITAAWLAFCVPGLAKAQDNAKPDPTPASPNSLHADASHDPAPADSKAPTADATSTPDAQMSLGEIARLARAKKNSQAKSINIFDDDNMPRAPISAGEKAPGFSGDKSSGGRKVTLLDFWAT